MSDPALVAVNPGPARRKRPGMIRLASADAVAGLAALAGVTLAAADLSLLRDSMRAGEGQRWAVPEVAVTDPADNLLLARELASLFLLDERVLVACQHLRTADEMFRQLKDVVTSTGMLSRQLKRVSSANGAQRIDLLAGGLVRFTGLSGGRGFAADLVVIHCDRISLGRARADLLPSAMSRPDPQIWYAL